MGTTQKLAPRANGLPTQVQADIDATFPLIWPDWNFDTDEGREMLWVYCQILMGPPGGLQIYLR